MVQYQQKLCLVISLILPILIAQSNTVLPVQLDTSNITPAPASPPSAAPTYASLGSLANVNTYTFNTQNNQPTSTNVINTSASTTTTQKASSNLSTADPINPNAATLSNVLKTQALTTSPSSTETNNGGYFTYQAATTAFNALAQSGGCKNGNIIKGVSLRQHGTQNYLTSNMYYLSLTANSSPNSQQLYVASQNIDCTWSFKTAQNLYISLNTAFSYLSLSSNLGTGERFYMERNQDWIYIESANSYRSFWTVSNGIAIYGMNQAARFVMEVWPTLIVGWN